MNVLPFRVEKRKERDEDDETITMPPNKVQKTPNDDVAVVGASELASAFALASLAGTKFEGSLEEREKTNIVHTMSRETESVDGGSIFSWEARSPKNESAPLSPEVRSPLSRRVTFAPNIRDRMGPRRYSFPPRVGPPPAMPPAFPPMSTPMRSPPLPAPWLLNRNHHPPFHSFQRYPSIPPSPSPWVCDFCNVAAFPTFQAACAHEQGCRARLAHEARKTAGPWNSPMSPYSDQRIQHPVMRNSFVSPQSPGHQSLPVVGHWFQGSLSLAMKDRDADWLSPLCCFIRERCVEAFAVASATEEVSHDVSKSGRLATYQVGIRCRFCKTQPEVKTAVTYPATLADIFDCVQRWHYFHVDQCCEIPDDVKTKLKEFQTENSWSPSSRHYWADSAKALGLVETPEGVRFARDPACFSLDQQHMSVFPQSSCMSSGETRPADHQRNIVGKDGGKSIQDGEYIVYPEDIEMVPPYVYFLMRQVEGCHFTEADRFVARSKGPVGYPGFQCRHCNGHAGLGKYFPITAKSLATNSTSQNIHAHLLKCRKCPPQIKDQLLALKEEKGKLPRLEPGWRKMFFDKIWSRIHGSTCEY
ncbi:hypothetical protein FisN_30Lh083 [Fistulifera solaris]|uniref:Uncharacterized protein n=1 Tax=Fistulifera solaris TaxID=1519565 RepID=A0A1Z5JIG5_FISSO|nr:hypothetical protein FisN_30Lh083 [Fistulifera solaris]|eukprot:GAX13789.1 hypothetical protein FisN_30Lh083 [Fistulifera solaris]